MGMFCMFFLMILIFRILYLYIYIRIDYVLKNYIALFIYCRHEVIYTKYEIMAGSSDVSHNVHNLQPGMEYLFVVTATNQAGEGAMSNSRSAKTLNAGLI